MFHEILPVASGVKVCVCGVQDLLTVNFGCTILTDASSLHVTDPAAESHPTVTTFVSRLGSVDKGVYSGSVTVPSVHWPGARDLVDQGRPMQFRGAEPLFCWSLQDVTVNGHVPVLQIGPSV